MMPKSAHQCHAIGCPIEMPFGLLFCPFHSVLTDKLERELLVELVTAHHRFYRVDGRDLVRNLTGDAAQDAMNEATYGAALANVVVELAKLEGKPVPASERPS